MERLGNGRSKRSTGIERFALRIVWALLVIAMLPGVAAAGSTTYQYDELGRLTAVTRDGVAVQYEYDQAGNRTQETTLRPPGTPGSISVPSNNSTGSYTISWTSATGSVAAYELYEATNSSFSDPVNVYSGTGASANLSGRASGTYYYRVRACNLSGCSGYRTGDNAVTVMVPPGVPASISVPTSNTTGSYTVSWGAASGAVTSYQLYEATNTSFSGQVQVYTGTGTSTALSGRGNGTYYYRVRACNGSACSDYRTGSNGVAVTLPPGVPASISVPSSSSTGAYTISWGTSTGNVTAYELYEATSSSFSGQTRVYYGTGTSTALSGRGNGTYYYRVRACNGSACSGYRAGGNATTVTLTPSVPASISVPSTNNTGSYTISWGSSSGNVTAYQLFEATDSSFSGQTQVHNETGTSKVISGKTDGMYYYRVRACNGSLCSDYRTGANPTSVTLPPAAPATISGPFQSSGSYTISWSASDRATRYELWESLFGGGFVKVYDGSGTSRSFSSQPAGEYDYKAKACNAGGCSAFSPTRHVTVCNGPCL